MGKDSGIQWTHHTFNPWRGCTKISAGCANCYAEQLSKRNPKVLGIWGDNGTRVVAGESYWQQPMQWDRAAKAAGERHRVFCASLADVFEDRPDLIEPRSRLMNVIHMTPNLDWLLLTKRPGNCLSMLAEATTGNPFESYDPPSNLWLGTSVENQEHIGRARTLLGVPAAIHFLSLEPLLSEVDLGELVHLYHGAGRHMKLWPNGCIDWFIIGCESLSGHSLGRPCDLAWVRKLVRAMPQKAFVKQIPWNGRLSGDPEDGWPADLRVREFPRVEIGR